MDSYIELERIPTRKDEAWKYTSLNGVLFPKMHLLRPSLAGLSHAPKLQGENSIWSRQLAEWPGPVVVLQRGAINDRLSRLNDAQIRVESSMAQLSKPSVDGEFSNFLDHVVNVSQTSLVRVVIEKNCLQPILFLLLHEGQETSQLINGSGDIHGQLTVYRIQVDIPTEVQAKIFYRFASVAEVESSKSNSLLVQITESLEQKSLLESVVLRDDDLSENLFVSHQQKQIENSQAQNFVCVVGGKSLTRYELKSAVNGPNTETDFNGLYILKGNAHADFSTQLNHQSADQKSSQTYSGVLDEQSKAVFRGEIHIAANCPRTATAQLNQNIVLSKDAEIDALPQLKIDTDDVKATHGATVGQLQDEELFYLQSRGIAKEEARRMIVEGFSRKALEKINDSFMREIVRKHVEAWI